LNSDTQLHRSALLTYISGAYAQEGDESKALNCIEQARKAMPTHPESDSQYRCLDFGESVIDEVEGQVYLYLARHFPQRDYAQKAFDAFDAATGKQSTADRTLGRKLILKAEAAMRLGNLHEYIDSLEQGTRIVMRIGSVKRQQEALIAFSKAPQSWHKEQRYQKLAKMF
jgi:hypothetical protein